MARRVLVCSDEAVPTQGQPKRPCSDCPWRRDALPGWLGGASVHEWIQRAHSETLIDCHTLRGPQCAGAAIYRANVLKLCRSDIILKLPADRQAVFSNPMEFVDYHQKLPCLDTGKDHCEEDPPCAAP